MSHTTMHISSSGVVAQLLNSTSKRVVAAADRAGIEPAEVRNGVWWYTEAQIELIRAELQAQREAKPCS